METMTKEATGAMLQGGSEAARRQAARLMGLAKTDAKAAASRQNGLKGGAHEFSEETRQKLRDAQKARREREQQEKAANQSVAVNAVAAPEGGGQGPGRPRTRQVVEAGERRGKGRPKGSPNKPQEGAK